MHIFTHTTDHEHNKNTKTLIVTLVKRNKVYFQYRRHVCMEWYGLVDGLVTEIYLLKHVCILCVCFLGLQVNWWKCVCIGDAEIHVPEVALTARMEK